MSTHFVFVSRRSSTLLYAYTWSENSTQKQTTLLAVANTTLWRFKFHDHKNTFHHQFILWIRKYSILSMKIFKIEYGCSHRMVLRSVVSGRVGETKARVSKKREISISESLYDMKTQNRYRRSTWYILSAISQFARLSLQMSKVQFFTSFHTRLRYLLAGQVNRFG